MGMELTEAEFHPQNNEQAYLAHVVGLLTDVNALPDPRTNEEVLLYQLALSGGSGCNGLCVPEDGLGSITIAYNKFRVEEAVQMFNELPDVTTLGLTAATVNLSQSPCSTGEYISASVDDGEAFVALLNENDLLDGGRYLNKDVTVTDARGLRIEMGANAEVSVTADKLERQFDFPVWSVKWAVETLTDADKVVATNKGWTVTG